MIRQLTPGDVKWASIISELIAKEAGMMHRSKEEIKEVILEGHAIGAFQNGQIVGFCLFEAWTPDVVEVGGLVVANSCRGNGLAPDLVRQTTSLARGTETIFSLAHSGPSANAFVKAGYRAVGLEILRSLSVDVWVDCKKCPCPCWIEGKFQGCTLNPLIY